MKDPNPAAASNNRHHTIAYRSQEDWYTTNLGDNADDLRINDMPLTGKHWGKKPF